MLLAIVIMHIGCDDEGAKLFIYETNLPVIYKRIMVSLLNKFFDFIKRYFLLIISRV